MVIPVVTDVTTMPTASALAEMIAIAASLCIRPFSEILSRRNAASTTTGIDTGSGDQPMATATDSAPNDTWDSPSPIIEYRFSTSVTPRSAAQSDTRIPPRKALTRKG